MAYFRNTVCKCFLLIVAILAMEVENGSIIRCFVGRDRIRNEISTRTGSEVNCDPEQDSCLLEYQYRKGESAVHYKCARQSLLAHELARGFRWGTELDEDTNTLVDKPVASLYNTSMVGKCVMFTNQRIWCFCDTDGCNLEYVLNATQCFVGRIGEPDLNMLASDTHLLDNGSFKAPAIMSCLIGGCAKIKVISGRKLLRNGTEIDVDDHDAKSKFLTDEVLQCFPACHSHLGANEEQCFNVQLPDRRKNFDQYLLAEACCCEHDLCNNPDRKWKENSSEESLSR